MIYKFIGETVKGCPMKGYQYAVDIEFFTKKTGKFCTVTMYNGQTFTYTTRRAFLANWEVSEFQVSRGYYAA